MSDLGGPVHWVDFGGPGTDEGVPVVMVHGLGGSHLNWVALGPALAGRHHAYAIDLAGFGLTSGTNRSTTVQANAELVARFVREVVGRPVVLIGNSMGGMVSLLVTSAHPDLVEGLVLIDPSIPIPRQRPDFRIAAQFALYATPFVGERYMTAVSKRVSDRQRVQGVVDLCFADPSKADPAVVDAGVELAAHRRKTPGQEAAFLGAARSLMKVLAAPGRYQSLIRGIETPVLLVHGELDRLVPVAAARAIAASNPRWETEFLPGVGHTPQLEAHEAVHARTARWLAEHHLSDPVATTAIATTRQESSPRTTDSPTARP